MRQYKVGYAILVIGLAMINGVGCRLFSQSGPMMLSAIDKEVLKRTESQLQTLQLRYNAEAAPIVKEHDDLVAVNCTKAGLIAVGPSANCVVDLNTGIISAKSTQVNAKAK